MAGEVAFVKRQRDLVKLASKTACAGKQSIEKQSLSRLNRPIQIQDKYKDKEEDKDQWQRDLVKLA